MPHTIHFDLPRAEDLSLAETLDCGQAFRFSLLPDGCWEGVACGRFCRIKQEGTVLEITCFCSGGCRETWADYFDLNRDYQALKDFFCTDEVLCRAVQFCPGVRLLHQDGWEALCAFIISQNNNVSRIKGILARLCEGIGQPLPGGGHAFPDVQTLANQSPEDLAVLRAGFRVPYLLDAARKVAEGALCLNDLYTLPLEEARHTLMQIKGVGPKVADCVLLFGFGRLACFPQDVWIKRALQTLYPQGFPAQFAPVAGIAQQYLFHYCRTCPQALEPVGAL